MSQKAAKLARKVARRFGYSERELKNGGDGLPAKVKASAYRKMRAVLKVQRKLADDWMPK